MRRSSIAQRTNIHKAQTEQQKKASKGKRDKVKNQQGISKNQSI